MVGFKDKERYIYIINYVRYLKYCIIYMVIIFIVWWFGILSELMYDN